jgi:hypothetical protein
MANPIQLITIGITTDAAGAFAKEVSPQSGRLLQYRYTPHATTPLDTGADLDIVGSTSGFVYANQDNIGTSAFTKAPRQPTHDDTGAASLYAAAGEPVEDHMWIAGEPLDVTIANGGNTLSGTLYLWIG